jgi:signal transduction histidine kinase
MRTGSPQTALEAVTWRRLPVSRWPWRSAGYLLTTQPIALLAAAGLAVPWLVLAGLLASGQRGPVMIVVLVLLGAAAIAGLGPLIAPPLAGLERRRLRLADNRPAGGARHAAPDGPGPRAWLRARYGDPGTWREVAYAVLLATVAPVLSAAAMFTLPLAAVLIAGPFLVLAQQPGSKPVALVFGTVATVGQALPYAIGGLLVLPLLPYLLTLVAGGQAAVARALLLDGAADELRAELTEVSRSRARLADAFEAERRRIERDLHDGAQQRLVSLTLQLGLARLDLPPGSPAAQPVAAAHEQAKLLMAELRELIHGIQPQVLTDLGLPAAIGELADTAPVPVEVDAGGLAGRLPEPVENTAYFVVAEALTNIAKHSGATSARVTARQRDGVLAVEITDNGRGGASPAGGTGLTGLADRVAVAGGRMLLSSPDGGPTVLRAELPCPPGGRP